MSAVTIEIEREGEDYVLRMHMDRAVALDAGRCVHVRDALGRRVAATLGQLAPDQPLAQPQVTGGAMRKLLALVVLALLAAVPARAQEYYSSGSAGKSVTQTNTVVTFTDNHSGGSNAAFLARSIRVFSRSTSANTCYVDFGDTTATTADVAIAPGKSVTITLAFGGFAPEAGWAGIGLICSSSQTATFDVFATRAWISVVE